MRKRAFVWTCPISFEPRLSLLSNTNEMNKFNSILPCLLKVSTVFLPRSYIFCYLLSMNFHHSHNKFVFDLQAPVQLPNNDKTSFPMLTFVKCSRIFYKISIIKCRVSLFTSIFIVFFFMIKNGSFHENTANNYTLF